MDRPTYLMEIRCHTCGVVIASYYQKYMMMMNEDIPRHEAIKRLKSESNNKLIDCCVMNIITSVPLKNVSTSWQSSIREGREG